MKSGETVSFDPRIVLRPRTLDETFDLAMAYTRAFRAAFARIFALVGATGLLIVLAATWLFDLSVVARAALTILIAPVLESMITLYAGRHLFANSARLGSAIRTVLGRSLLLVPAAAITALPVAVSVLDTGDSHVWLALGINLGLVWWLALSPLVYLKEVALLEQKSGGAMARRARGLVMDRYGRALGLVLLSFLVRALLALIFQLMTQFTLSVVLQFGNVSGAIGWWPAITGWILASTYVALARLFDYVDARTRREGWDIQVRFNGIAQRAAASDARRIAA